MRLTRTTLKEVDRQAALKRECFSPEQCLKVIMHDLNDDTKYDKCKNW